MSTIDNMKTRVKAKEDSWHEAGKINTEPENRLLAWISLVCGAISIALIVIAANTGEYLAWVPGSFFLIDAIIAVAKIMRRQKNHICLLREEVAYGYYCEERFKDLNGWGGFAGGGSSSGSDTG